MLRDWFDNVRYFVEDHKRWFGWGIAAVLIGLLILVLVLPDKSGSAGVGSNTNNELKELKAGSKELEEVFSQLQETPVGTSDSLPAYEVSLYLKQPFISEDDLTADIQKYVDLMKLKVNDDKNDKYLLGLKIKVYDRKIVFDKDLTPRATAYYMLKKESSKDSKTEDQYDSLGDQDELIWDKTLQQTKNPNYKEDYQLLVNGFSELDDSQKITPLSDEEFAFYLKLNMYNSLMGDTYGGAQLYLQWDLGRNVSNDGVVAIVNEFENFEKRQTDIGGLDDYYDNVDYLKQDLAIKNPQFLLFATTNEVVDDAQEAQKKLIESDPDLYTQVIEDHIQEKADQLGEQLNTDEKDKTK
ncbi:hypothetical protein MOD96_01980 [Bacillus sp. S17B2]|uniref:hypothetical protein n=1 Tax=Bacillus sp. S17B2 TaxID=2918907 RepID=UPI00227FF20D|nr:hypothetical protein [Bacillus sp. S17B2]